MILDIGQRINLSELSKNFNKIDISFLLDVEIPIDVLCLAINNNNNLDDNNIIFENNKKMFNDSIIYKNQNKTHLFNINLTTIPHLIEKLVFVCSVKNNTHKINNLNNIKVNIYNSEFVLLGNSFKNETAIIMFEIYKKNNIWKIAVISQGFNGGLHNIFKLFNSTTDINDIKPKIEQTSTILKNEIIHDNPVILKEENIDEKPVILNKIETPNKINLNKKIFLEKRVNLEKQLISKQHKLVELSKKAAISLGKCGLGQHKAKVALCLDISGSMEKLYLNGIIQEFSERILALSTRLDDDGIIDVFLFGSKSYQVKSISIHDFKNYIPELIKKYNLEADTSYSSVIELIRKHYTKKYKHDRITPLKMETPVYVMFLTDGEPNDKRETNRMLRNASFEPIYWQFIGIGNLDFSYLKGLNNLIDRFIPNIGFFSINDLSKITEEELFSKLTTGYPKWVNLITNKGMIDE